jgi:2-polyprenyl-3-methyl-5-hydroxy-6-metoxy-1,4-benzoquinol methylase
MARDLRARGAVVGDITGIRFSPLNWSFSLDDKDLDVNYLLVAIKPH